MAKKNNVKVKIIVSSKNGQQVLYRTGSNAAQIVCKEYERAKKTHAYVTYEIIKKHNQK